MVEEDTVTMSGKELRRGHVIRQVLDRKLTQVKAATVLDLSPRQVRRLMTRVRQEGDGGLVHRGRGQPSNRRIPEGHKTKRVLRRDWTVAHNGHLYQVHTNVRAMQVVMEDRLDGTLRMTHRGHVLAYHPIAERPVRPADPRSVSRRHRPVKQARTHPWRKPMLPPREILAAAGST